MATLSVYRGTQAQCASKSIVDGQLLFETDQGNDGKLYLDNGTTRLTIGGNYMGKYEVTFPASGWTSTAPYTNTVTVNGVTSTMQPIPMINFSSATSQDEKNNIAQNAFYIDFYTISDGSIIATATYDKPTVDLIVDFLGQ
jgi:hypothetical protein